MKKPNLKIPDGDYLIFCTSIGDSEQVPLEIQILPYGKIHTEKGDFLVDDQATQQVIANFNKKKNDKVIDYEHQTLSGQEAPAAGWIKELFNRGSEGIWGKIDWTPRAVEYIKNKEYRYFSPVIIVSKKDRRPVNLHSGALTNDPAIDGMEPIINKSGVSLDREENDDMDLLKKIIEILGLDESASEDDVLQAIKDLANNAKEEATMNKAVIAVLGLKDKAKQAEVTGAIIALKNPSGYVKVEEFNQIKDKLNKRDRDELVEMALKSGKVIPAQKAWAELYALNDPEGFKAFLAQAPVVVPLDKITEPKNPLPEASSETQILVNKNLGINEEAFKKYNH